MTQMIAGTRYTEPALKSSTFNTAVLANTDILATDLTPTNSPTTFRIYAAFNAAGVLIVRRTRGGVAISEELNSGAALVADAAYMFDILVETGDTINIQYSVGATCLSLKVFEVLGVIS